MEWHEGDLAWYSCSELDDKIMTEESDAIYENGDGTFTAYKGMKRLDTEFPTLESAKRAVEDAHNQQGEK